MKPGLCMYVCSGKSCVTENADVWLRPFLAILRFVCFQWSLNIRRACFLICVCDSDTYIFVHEKDFFFLSKKTFLGKRQLTKNKSPFELFFFISLNSLIFFHSLCIRIEVFVYVVDFTSFLSSSNSTKFIRRNERKKNILCNAPHEAKKRHHERRRKEYKKKQHTLLNTCAMYENRGAVATVEECALLENILV